MTIWFFVLKKGCADYRLHFISDIQPFLKYNETLILFGAQP